MHSNQNNYVETGRMSLNYDLMFVNKAGIFQHVLNNHLTSVISCFYFDRYREQNASELESVTSDSKHVKILVEEITKLITKVSDMIAIILQT